MRQRVNNRHNVMSNSSAQAALGELQERSLLSGTDWNRLRIIAESLGANGKAPTTSCWEALFAGLSPVNAETALRKLIKRLKDVQQQAIDDGKLPAVLLELKVTRKSGNTPRYFWFSGELVVTAGQARTADLAGVPSHTLQDQRALPPELLGQAPKGGEPILILTVNEHETQAVRTIFAKAHDTDSSRSFLRDERLYELLGDAQRRPIIGFRCRMGSSTMDGSLLAVSDAIRHHCPAVVIAVGIAFGRMEANNKQQLGDVLISTEARSYESGRVNPDSSVTPRGTPLLAADNWVQRAMRIKPKHFKLHQGLMVSGEKLLDNKKFTEQLWKDYPNAIGGDMESVGLMIACYTAKVDWIVIKGVSDWGDGNKNVEKKEEHQHRAALNAAQVAYAAIHLSWPKDDAADPPTATEPPALQIQARPPDFPALDTWLQTSARISDYKNLPAMVDNPARRHDMAAPRLGSQPDRASPSPTLTAHEILLNWLQDKDAAPLFAVLGEYGMGKTITCQRLYHDLIDRRKKPQPPSWARQPLYFDLRTLTLFKNHDRAQVVAMPGKAELINDLIKHGWQLAPGQIAPSFDDVQRLLAQGGLLILDGLDECLVHLVDAQHRDFIRSLLELLTDADPKGKQGTRLLLSCRSNFFKTLRDQNKFFTLQHHGQIRAQWYQSILLLPFSEDQISQYLRQVVPQIPVEKMLALVRNTHNLSELAERPMTLRMISEQIEQLETMRAAGEYINAASLYTLVAKSWLERDGGKHHLAPEHKLRLMPDLAAQLWRLRVRSLPYEELHRWFHAWRAQQADLVERYHPRVYNQNKLEEDLRTASFVVRQDEDAQSVEGFRFAHSSLQEFFLARYLANAVLHDQAAHWVMPRPSQETLNFLSDLLTTEQDRIKRQGGNSQALSETLNRWRTTYRKDASELLLHFALTAPASTPRPLLAGFNLQGAQLQDWRFERAESDTPLIMSGCQLQGADLRRSRFHGVYLDNADFSRAQLDLVSFEACNLRNAHWQQSQLTGSVFRHCVLQGCDFSQALAYCAQRVACSGDTTSNAHPTPANAWLSPPSDTLQTGGLQWFDGHRDAVTAVAFAPDGARIASASFKTVRIWDTRSGQLLLSLRGHEHSVNAVAFAPDGARIASASRDQTVRIWDAYSGQLLLSLRGHEYEVKAVAFAPDGARIASASFKTVRIWDASSGQLLLSLHGHEDWVRAVAFAPDGARIASASFKTVRIWDASSGQLLLSLHGHERDVNTVVFAPDGARIASASNDKTVRIWDAFSGQLLLSLQGHQDYVNAVAFDPDGARIASASDDKTVRIWDASSGQLLLSLQGHESRVKAVAFAPDGARIASASYDHTVRIWDAYSGQFLLSLQGHEHEVRAVAFDPDGARIASASNDKTVRIWDAFSGQLLLSLQGHKRDVNTVVFAPDGTRIASASFKTVRIWDAFSGQLLLSLQGHKYGVNTLAFAPDGARIASASDDQTVRIWDAYSGQLLLSLQGHEHWVNTVTFAPDGARIASASDDQTVRIWDAYSGQLLLSLQGHQDRVNAVAFAPDGARITSASLDKTVRIWDAYSGQLLLSLQGHEHWVNTVTFAPDGARIASASDDKTVRIWDASSGQLLLSLQGHESRVKAVAFAPDGARIASADDHSVRLWNAHSGVCEQISVWLAEGGMEGHAAWVPPQVEAQHPAGRLISASGNAWRWLGWQVWDHPSAPKQWARLPLDAYPTTQSAK